MFVVGGPLAISDAVVNELKDLISYQCGGVSPRLDPNTGLPKKLVVIRVFGDTVWDTNARLAEFVGAEPAAAFGPIRCELCDQPVQHRRWHLPVRDAAGGAGEHRALGNR